MGTDDVLLLGAEDLDLSKALFGSNVKVVTLDTDFSNFEDLYERYKNKRFKNAIITNVEIFKNKDNIYKFRALIRDRDSKTKIYSIVKENEKKSAKQTYGLYYSTKTREVNYQGKLWARYSPVPFRMDLHLKKKDDWQDRLGRYNRNILSLFGEDYENLRRKVAKNSNSISELDARTDSILDQIELLDTQIFYLDGWMDFFKERFEEEASKRFPNEMESGKTDSFEPTSDFLDTKTTDSENKEIESLANFDGFNANVVLPLLQKAMEGICSAGKFGYEICFGNPGSEEKVKIMELLSDQIQKESSPEMRAVLDDLKRFQANSNEFQNKKNAKNTFYPKKYNPTCQDYQGYSESQDRYRCGLHAARAIIYDEDFDLDIIISLTQNIAEKSKDAQEKGDPCDNISDEAINAMLTAFGFTFIPLDVGQINRFRVLYGSTYRGFLVHRTGRGGGHWVAIRHENACFYNLDSSNDKQTRNKPISKDEVEKYLRSGLTDLVYVVYKGDINEMELDAALGNVVLVEPNMGYSFSNFLTQRPPKAPIVAKQNVNTMEELVDYFNKRVVVPEEIRKLIPLDSLAIPSLFWRDIIVQKTFIDLAQDPKNVEDYIKQNDILREIIKKTDANFEERFSELLKNVKLRGIIFKTNAGLLVPYVVESIDKEVFFVNTLKNFPQGEFLDKKTLAAFSKGDVEAILKNSERVDFYIESQTRFTMSDFYDVWISYSPIERQRLIDFTRGVFNVAEPTDKLLLDFTLVAEYLQNLEKEGDENKDFSIKNKDKSTYLSGLQLGNIRLADIPEFIKMLAQRKNTISDTLHKYYYYFMLVYFYIMLVSYIILNRRSTEEEESTEDESINYDEIVKTTSNIIQNQLLGQKIGTGPDSKRLERSEELLGKEIMQKISHILNELRTTDGDLGKLHEKKLINLEKTLQVK